MPHHWRKLTNTPCPDSEDITFEVIHPFHPLYKQKFKLFTYYHNWESHRVNFYNNENRFVSLPTSWTSLFPKNLFVEQSAGRSLFKVADLLSLSQLIETFNQEIIQIDSVNLNE
ncbi:MAG: hypothetical protein HOD92_14985 [Deltaproteobacteria bacterium]|nr:hypothetical protein [Deltaproteobacteria bacterium]MBT4525011.1 hypothetical protein [Deltaproteobacteria bacterium]